MAISIMEVADSLSAKQKELFLELTEKVNLLNPTSYKHLDLSKYETLLEDINDLYDGKIDYIKKALDSVKKHNKWKMNAEKIISEIVKL